MLLPSISRICSLTTQFFASQPVFTLEANPDEVDGEKSYRFQPIVENSRDGIMLQLIQQKQEEEALQLNETCPILA